MNITSFVVVELKATELKKEYIGQIQNKTIGIIMVKKDNKFVSKYII